MNLVNWMERVRRLAAAARGYGPNTKVGLKHERFGDKEAPFVWIAFTSDGARTLSANDEEHEVAATKLVETLEEELEREIVRQEENLCRLVEASEES